MDFKKLNEILKDLNNLRGNITTIVETIVETEIEEGGSQGDSGVSYEIHKSPFPDVFIRLTINTDSYGNNEFVNGVEFVKITSKQVTVYETI